MELYEANRALFFSRGGSKPACSCLSCNSCSPAAGVGGQAGTHEGKVAPPKHVSETKTDSHENHRKDYAEGEGKSIPRHHCSLRLAFQGVGLGLLPYNLSSMTFWTHPSLPRHQQPATALTIGSCWRCLTMGGRMRKRGMCFNLCLHKTSLCPGRNSPVVCNWFPV